MRIVFASSHPYIPQIAGGTQSNTHEMTVALIKRGHRVAVLSGLTGKGLIGLRDRVFMKLTGCRAVSDNYVGYPVFRTWHATDGVDVVKERVNPDVAIVQSGAVLKLAGEFRKTGIPMVIYNHNVDFSDHGADIKAFMSEVFIANSVYTSQKYLESFGIRSQVILPFFDPKKYAVRSDRSQVLFVNPHPQKGLDIALHLARECSDIPFRFVMSWSLAPEMLRSLRRSLADLPNVTLFRSTSRMRQHYAHARVLLAPSRWAETWGRVVTEAQFSGIPALATRIGGLVEAVGQGGLLVDPGADLPTWTRALRSICDDKILYGSLADAARQNLVRVVDIDMQVDAMEQLLASALMNSVGGH